MDEISLKETDLYTEVFIPEEPKTVAEHLAMLANPPIRVTHLPTGMSAVGEGQGSQIKNKERAIELLEAQLERNNT